MDMNAASILRSRAIAIASAGIVGAGLLGGVALASTPSTTDAVSMTVSDTRSMVASADKTNAKLKAVLADLVTKGTITQAQADAILAAYGSEHRDGGRTKEFIGDVFKQSADYLGLTAEQVKQQLRAGNSLGEIANQTPTKSRDGLLNALDLAAANRIQAAVAAGKITQAQADALTPKVDAAIVKIVDHKHAPKPAKTAKPTN
jgi:polyhydroxyalkanoate synthesis regulator phasin